MLPSVSAIMDLKVMATIVLRKAHHARKQTIAMCTPLARTLKKKENRNAFAILDMTVMGIVAKLQVNKNCAVSTRIWSKTDFGTNVEVGLSFS